VICGVFKFSEECRVCAPGLVVLLEPDPLLGGGGPEREQGGRERERERERGWKRECPSVSWRRDRFVHVFA